MALEKSEFFKVMTAQGIALTFDDVRLDTGRSHVAAYDVDIEGRFSRNVTLPTPMVSAAMDTVTTAEMAIAMAKLGGLGVIHAGLTPDQQRRAVRKVKLELNGKIDTPVVVQPKQTIKDVLAMCEEKRFNFRTFPVIDAEETFLGLLTQHDIDFSHGKGTVEEAMTAAESVVTGDTNTTIEQAYALMKDRKTNVVPLVDASGKVAGLYIHSDVIRLIDGNPEHYNLDENGRLRTAAAVPTDDGALERIELMKDYLDVAVVDTAQGDSDYAVNTLKQIKQKYPDLDVVVGNISNAGSARQLAEAGADGIKVGQGPGSICTTRIETGIGSPQVSAVYACAQAVKDFDIPICADGGITNPGDISIAIAAGASSVMMGSGLAGTKESPGEVIVNDDNEMVKLYRGMGSPSALRDSAAARKRYGADASSGKPLSEGVESHISYKGSVVDVMDHYIKALRKSMSYVGAPDMQAHQQNTRFLRITNAGFRESKPHDVTLI